MRKTTYHCDHCLKEIGKKKHISLSFGDYSGIAVPPPDPIKPLSPDFVPLKIFGLSQGWTVQESIQGKFMHFCNGQCIGNYFRNLLAMVKE